MEKKSATLEKIHAMLYYYGVKEPIDIEPHAIKNIYQALMRDDVMGAEIDEEGGLVIYFYEEDTNE
jgi:hypothetical protein